MSDLHRMWLSVMVKTASDLDRKRRRTAYRKLGSCTKTGEEEDGAAVAQWRLRWSLGSPWVAPDVGGGGGMVLQLLGSRKEAMVVHAGDGVRCLGGEGDDGKRRRWWCTMVMVMAPGDGDDAR